MVNRDEISPWRQLIALNGKKVASLLKEALWPSVMEHGCACLGNSGINQSWRRVCLECFKEIIASAPKCPARCADRRTDTAFYVVCADCFRWVRKNSI